MTKHKKQYKKCNDCKVKTNNSDVKLNVALDIELNTTLNAAKLSGHPNDITEWWFLKNRSQYKNFAKLGMGEFYQDGIIIKYAYEWDPYYKDGPKLHPYQVEINPICIPWDNFWNIIFDEYTNNLEYLYKLYPNVVIGLWKRQDKTADEWYEDLFNDRYTFS